MLTLFLSAWPAQDDDLVPRFLEGKAEARERLLGRGVAALPDLLKAREKADDKSRPPLLDLIFESKKTTLEDLDEQGPLVFTILEKTKLTVNFSASTAREILDYPREFTNLNFVVAHLAVRSGCTDRKGGGRRI